MHIIDRRLNPGGKSLGNRQRFLRRAKALIKRAVRDSAKERGIKDFEAGGEVSIPLDGVKEYRFHHSGQGGLHEHLLPGNKDYVEGQNLPRPPQNGQSGSEGGQDGEGLDDFRFVLSQDEFMQLFLEDLELPELAKTQLASSETVVWQRAGYSSTGSPSNLSIARTMRNSLARRLAMHRPHSETIRVLREQIEALEKSGADVDQLVLLRQELETLLLRAKRIPFIDPVDLHYRRSEPHPKPVVQAVMFCLMDVSGSMTEHMKDLAKRFFTLLYLFLKRRYRHVEIVFIRHTHQASEVDEQTFFYSAESGGTVVSTALEEMLRVVKSRFKPEDWNIYAAQASDGENSSSDNDKTALLLSTAILPISQYYAYLEVGSEDEAMPVGFTRNSSDLWRTYEKLRPAASGKLAMRKVRHRRDIYPVFRDLFQRQATKT